MKNVKWLFFDVGSTLVDETAAFFGLKKTPWHHEDEAPYPDAGRVLGELENRGYHIGIIANQSAGTADRLDNDTAPAKAVGMGTVWLPQGPAVWQSVRGEAECPDVRVESLAELPEVLP